MKIPQSSVSHPYTHTMVLAAVMQCCGGQALAAACRAGERGRRTACACVAAAGGGRKRAPRFSSGAGPPAEQPPPAAAGAARPPAAAAAAAAGLSPLSDRRLLAEKLTHTAKNIVWGDLRHERPQEASKERIHELQERLGYRFSNLYLLRLALIHSSAAPTTHNSIMAWIGDAAMYLVVAEEVAAALGYAPIGQLRCGSGGCCRVHDCGRPPTHFSPERSCLSAPGATPPAISAAPLSCAAAAAAAVPAARCARR